MPWETPRECLLSDRLGQKKESKGEGEGEKAGNGTKTQTKESIGNLTQISGTFVVMFQPPLWDSKMLKWISSFSSFCPCFCVFWDEYWSVIVSFLFVPPPVFTKGLANHSIRLYFTPFTLANLSLPLDWFAAFFLSPPLKQQHTDIHSPSTPGHSVGRKEGVTLVHRSGNAFSCFVHYPKSNMFSLPFSFSLKN